MKADAWGYGGENKDNEGEAVKVKWAGVDLGHGLYGS